MSNEQKLEEMKFADVQNLAKARGLKASGTKEELIARLNGEDSSEENSEATPSTQKSEEEEQESTENEEDTAADAGPEATPLGKTTDTVPEQSAIAVHRTRARKQKEYLDSQEKVSFFIPLEDGADPANSAPFHISINGYEMDYPRGQMVEVPKDVFQIIRERLESEGKIGRQNLVSANPEREQALA